VAEKFFNDRIKADSTPEQTAHLLPQPLRIASLSCPGTGINTLYATENFKIPTTRGASGGQNDMRAASMGLSAQSQSCAQTSPECAAASTPTLCDPTGRIPGSLSRDDY